MKLIKRLNEYYGKSRPRRLGLFFCPACKREVKKDLYNGEWQKTCGCQMPEKHYSRNTRLLNIFRGMHKRCNSLPSEFVKKNYHKKGIKVCSEWKSFNAFKKWAKSIGYQENLFIVRKDLSKGYCPENCKLSKKRRKIV